MGSRSVYANSGISAHSSLERRPPTSVGGPHQRRTCPRKGACEVRLSWFAKSCPQAWSRSIAFRYAAAVDLQKPDLQKHAGPAPAVADLRASDADRDRIADILREALAEGRLTADEHAERVEGC